MFELTKEFLSNLKEAINPNVQFAPMGPNIHYSCMDCRGSCKNSCRGACKGSCQGGCTRSCRGNSR